MMKKIWFAIKITFKMLKLSWDLSKKYSMNCDEAVEALKKTRRNNANQISQE